MVLDPDRLTVIFRYCAIIGTAIFFIKIFLPIDSGSEVGGDFNSADYSDSSFNFFTVEGVSAFFMTMGWIGWYSIVKMHYDIAFCTIISLLSGVISMGLFTYLITQFRKLEHNPKVTLKELEGKKGRSYMNFTPKGIGKIQIEFNSKLDILDAKNNSDEFIKAFEPIKVVKIEDNEIYIEKDV